MTHKGAIAAGHPATAEAAATMLEAGGNAYDAAIAAVLAACVAEPVLASLGGGGFLMAKPAGQPATLYDFFPQTPMATTPASGGLDFHPVLADFGPAQQPFHIGLGSMATPGLVRGLFRLRRDLASMPMARLIEPAVRLARQGVKVTPLQAYILEVVQSIYLATPACRAAYGSRLHPGRTAAAGEVLVSPAFADALETLAAEGEDVFYAGPIGDALAADCAAHGGLLTRADLADYRVAVRAPLEVAFHGARVLINPPPAIGGLLVGFGLELLAGRDLDGAAFGSARHLRRLAAALALTNQARAEFPLHEIGETEAAGFLEPARMAAYRRRLAGGPVASRGTTHISVVDAAGNAASLTATNGEGAAYIIPGTGIMMNNMLGEDDLNPGGFHRGPGGLRLRSMTAPCLVEFADGRIEAVGSGGSSRIRSAMLQVLVNQLVFGLDLRQAVDRPRLHVEGSRLSLEAGFEAAAVAPLAEIFAPVERWDDINFFFGGVHGVRFDPRTGAFDGAGDPRRGGVFRLI